MPSGFPGMPDVALWLPDPIPLYRVARLNGDGVGCE